MNEVTALLEYIKNAGMLGLLVMLIAAFWTGKIRLEREYLGIKRDRDFWKEIACKRIAAALEE